MNQAKIEILIADDAPLIRDGLRELFAKQADMELIGECTTGQEAIEKSLELQPDIVLMDIQMPPGLNGIEATRKIYHSTPHIRIIILTQYPDDDLVFAAIRAGARGYLLKTSGQEEILQAVHAISQGESFLSPAIATKVLVYLFDHSDNLIFPSLTDREREVLDLVARGLNDKAIAIRLSIAPKTVRNHVSNIVSKLQAADRYDLIVKGIKGGLGSGLGKR